MRPSGYGGPMRPRSNFSFGPPGSVPTVVSRLIALNVAVYFFQQLTGDWCTREFALIPALVERGEIWRLFSYQFLHGGNLHLLLNMFVLWMFGSELASKWGAQFFLRYYFLCAVGGGILFTLARLGTWVPSVGASGAIYGILVAYAMWFPNRRVYLYFVLPIPVRVFVFLLLLLEVSQSVLSSGTGIAHAAHLGGMAFGYAYLRWNGVSGLRPFSDGTLRRWKLLWRRWRLRREMRSRGWDDTNSLH